MAHNQYGKVRNKYPIFVISKGRPQSCLTARELDSMGAKYWLVVEPQEADTYTKAGWGGRMITTPFSNLGQGSIPVRNYVWDLAVSDGNRKHWVLDDNIEGFHRLHENEKYKVADETIFRCCEEFSDRYANIALSGMNYHSFAKATDPVPPFYLNTRIYSCILVNHAIPHRWRGKYNEDTDLSIRCLKDGWVTVLFNAFLCGKVTTQRMKGGNTDEVYAGTDDRMEFAESLAQQHPDVVTVTRKFGRWHHQVNYKPFKKNKLKPIIDLSSIKTVDNFGMSLTQP